MATSTNSCSNAIHEGSKQYPYPSHVNAASFMSVKLSGKPNYEPWQEQLMCLVKSHDMLGFIDGTLKKPLECNSCKTKEDMMDFEAKYREWKRSDTLVKGWIFGSLTENVMGTVVGLQTANDVWNKLKTNYAPSHMLASAPTPINAGEKVSGEEPSPNNASIINNYIDSIFKPNANTSPQPQPRRIPRVGEMVRKKEEYEKYYVPKVVSIGPYYYENEKLQSVQNLKRVFTEKLFSDKEETLRSLYQKLGEPKMVDELRSYYEEGSTTRFSDMDFTNMMLLDACFILQCILSIFDGIYEDCPELKNNEIFFIYQDLFLLENQIPFIVLKEVMTSLQREIECSKKIKSFIYGSILASGRPKQLKWLKSILCVLKNQSWSEESKWLKQLIDVESNNSEPDHLLELLHDRLTNTLEDSTKDINPKNARCNFRNVSELREVGIHFKPSDPMSPIPHVKLLKGWWGFSANVELPPMTVNDSTKPLLLNLMTYEACFFYVTDAWVTSYVCLLDSLIDDPEDVKVLRKAWVLENYLSGDKEVVQLFEELATDVVPNKLAYSETKNMIQRQYESRRNTLFSQLKKEYFKSPWAFLAFLGAFMILILTVVQTYFTVCSPKSTCDDLCMFLKMNHHL